MMRPLVLALLVITACTASSRDPEEPTEISSLDRSEVLSSAERHLDCARDDIEVGQTVEQDVYVATGCGRTGRFKISCTMSSHSSSSGESCTAWPIEEESPYEGED